MLSFLIAAVTIFLAAWCYTEFAARVSKTGSAYLFMYMSLGEFVAFLIGWASLFGNHIVSIYSRVKKCEV